MKAIPFPTMAQVETASREDLARWYRFLVPTDDDDAKLAAEQRKILARVKARFEAMGGMTPELSAKIGY